MIKFIESFEFDEGSDNHKTYIVMELADDSFYKYLFPDEPKVRTNEELMGYFC